jgi:hypothetical protein
MLKLKNFKNKMLPPILPIFNKLKVNFFCTGAGIQTEESSIFESTNINEYLKKSLLQLKNQTLKPIQNEIFETINKPTEYASSSLILGDDYCGRKFSCMLSIMNILLNNFEIKPEEENDDIMSRHLINDDDLFRDVKTAFQKSVANVHKNESKKLIKPHGALILCKQFDFVTQLYRICRKLDPDRLLRIVRVGTSLQVVAPTIDNEVI